MLLSEKKDTRHQRLDQRQTTPDAWPAPSFFLIAAPIRTNDLLKKTNDLLKKTNDLLKKTNDLLKSSEFCDVEVGAKTLPTRVRLLLRRYQAVSACL